MFSRTVTSRQTGIVESLACPHPLDSFVPDEMSVHNLLRERTFLNGLLKPVLTVQCRQGYRRRNAGSRKSRVVSDSSSFQVRSEASVGDANGFPVAVLILLRQVDCR